MFAIFQDQHSYCSIAVPDCPVQNPNRASGPKWGKNGRKMDLAPPRKGGKWPRNGKMAVIDPLFHFSAFFPLFSGWGQNPFFGLFFPFQPGGPIWGLFGLVPLFVISGALAIWVLPAWTSLNIWSSSMTLACCFHMTLTMLRSKADHI